MFIAPFLLVVLDEIYRRLNYKPSTYSFFTPKALTIMRVTAPPPPKYQVKTRLCPHCDKHSRLTWLPERKRISVVDHLGNKTYISYGTIFLEKNFSASQCDHCGGVCLWLGAIQIYPDKISVEPPNPDLPEDIKKLYNEAASILQKSPRAAAALLRVALEKLCREQVDADKTLNENIEYLRDTGVIPQEIYEAMTVVRVVANQAVHPEKEILSPGQISFENDETKEIVESLFEMVNFIANETITKKKRARAMYEKVRPQEKSPAPK